MSGPRLTGVRVPIVVTPRAAANEIGPVEAGRLRLRVSAAPVDSAANAAIVRLLAERLGVPRSQVGIVSGTTARRKIVEVVGLTAAAVRAALGFESIE
jgi:uncharacterized protein